MSLGGGLRWGKRAGADIAARCHQATPCRFAIMHSSHRPPVIGAFMTFLPSSQLVQPDGNVATETVLVWLLHCAATIAVSSQPSS